MSDLRKMDRQIFFAPSNNSSFSSLQGASLPGRPGGASAIGIIDMEGALSQEEVINAIFDIAVRIFGARELALYTVEWDLSTLHLIGSRGVGAEVLINMRKGRMGAAAFSGKEYIAEGPASAHGTATEDRLAMCVPFVFNGTSAFVLAVYGYVSRSHLHGSDLEIVEFLRTHAATALNRQTE